METLNPYLFIHTGLIIRLLWHSHTFTIQQIIEQISTLYDNLTKARFLVSVAGLEQLKTFVEKLDKETDKTRLLNPGEVANLSAIMKIVESIVYAESQTKFISVLSEQRYSLECLLYHPEKMFKDGFFTRLPTLARSDLTEGFICLLLSRATAAAFHILRATEAVLREYYFTKIKRGREKKPMWGNMLIGLSKKRIQKEKLIKRLEYIKDNFRNPTNHPEAIYNIEEAQDLLGLCIDVINAMADELPKPKNMITT
jgi:hypothetical protein